MKQLSLLAFQLNHILSLPPGLSYLMWMVMNMNYIYKSEWCHWNILPSNLSKRKCFGICVLSTDPDKAWFVGPQGRLADGSRSDAPAHLRLDRAWTWTRVFCRSSSVRSSANSTRGWRCLLCPKPTVKLGIQIDDVLIVEPLSTGPVSQGSAGVRHNVWEEPWMYQIWTKI